MSHEQWGGGSTRTSCFEAQIGASSRTKYKRSKNVFAVTIIALSLESLGTHLLGLTAQSLISPVSLMATFPLCELSVESLGGIWADVFIEGGGLSAK